MTESFITQNRKQYWHNTQNIGKKYISRSARSETRFFPRLSAYLAGLRRYLSSFLLRSLTKEESARPKYRQLLDHSFVKRSSEDSTNVAQFVCRILDKMENNGKFMYTYNSYNYWKGRRTGLASLLFSDSSFIVSDDISRHSSFRQCWTVYCAGNVNQSKILWQRFFLFIDIYYRFRGILFRFVGIILLSFFAFIIILREFI